MWKMGLSISCTMFLNLQLQIPYEAEIGMEKTKNIENTERTEFHIVNVDNDYYYMMMWMIGV